MKNENPRPAKGVLEEIFHEEFFGENFSMRRRRGFRGFFFMRMGWRLTVLQQQQLLLLRQLWQLSPPPPLLLLEVLLEGKGTQRAKEGRGQRV